MKKHNALGSIVEFEAKYTEWFGKADETHQLKDVNIYVFPPTHQGEDKFWTYITGGMSLKRMQLPEEVEPDHEAGVLERAEYVFYSREKNAKYVSMLALLTIFPFVDRTFVARGHTVGLSEPLDDAGVLSAVFLLSSLFSGHQQLFDSVRVSGARVNYLWVVPISAAERTFKRKAGTDALLDLLEQHDNPLVFQGARESYC